MGNEWIGAAVTASLVSGIVTAFGWWANHLASIRLDGTRRVEKIRDYKSALVAEILANLDRFSDVDLAGHVEEMGRRFDEIGDTANSFTPFVPRYATTFVFDRLLNEIAVLPNSTIEPVVLYYKNEHRLSLFVEDLRSSAFSDRPAATKKLMYRDYVRMIVETNQTAERALAALREAGDIA